MVTLHFQPIFQVLDDNRILISSHKMLIKERALEPGVKNGKRANNLIYHIGCKEMKTDTPKT